MPLVHLEDDFPTGDPDLTPFGGLLYGSAGVAVGSGLLTVHANDNWWPDGSGPAGMFGVGGELVAPRLLFPVAMGLHVVEWTEGPFDFDTREATNLTVRFGQTLTTSGGGVTSEYGAPFNVNGLSPTLQDFWIGLAMDLGGSWTSGIWSTPPVIGSTPDIATISSGFGSPTDRAAFNIGLWVAGGNPAIPGTNGSISFSEFFFEGDYTVAGVAPGEVQAHHAPAGTRRRVSIIGTVGEAAQIEAGSVIEGGGDPNTANVLSSANNPDAQAHHASPGTVREPRIPRGYGRFRSSS